MSEREWRFYVRDMIGFAQKALAYTAGLDRDGFVWNEIVFDATVRNIELIGEAARSIPDDIRQAHPQIPWRQLIATRNRLVHAYLGLDGDVLWSIVRDDLPDLVSALNDVLARTLDAPQSGK